MDLGCVEVEVFRFAQNDEQTEKTMQKRGEAQRGAEKRQGISPLRAGGKRRPFGRMDRVAACAMNYKHELVCGDRAGFDFADGFGAAFADGWVARIFADVD